jgi:hypothetical protein
MDVRDFYGRKKTVCRVTTVAEALDAVSSVSNPVAIVVLPPQDGDRAVDSDSEDVPDNIENETAFETAGELEVEAEAECSDNDSDIEEPPAQKKKKTKGSRQKTWKKTCKFDTSLQLEIKQSVREQYPLLSEKSPVDLWNLIFNTNMIELVTEQTNLYGNRDSNDPDFKTTPAEIKRFIGILLLTGYHSVPHEDHYWSNSPDLGVPVISETMSNKRYHILKKYLHLADNQNLQSGDKVAKVSPLYNVLNDNLVQFGVWHADLSVDESMVPYYGRHGIKMFIKGKPIRFGFKLWVLCGADGFPYCMKIYVGKENGASADPLGTRVIEHMVDVVRAHSSYLYHTFFFDNFFTSVKLLETLTDRGIRATGTVRDNRIGDAKNCLITSKTMKKKEIRGNFQYCCNGKVYIAKWNDNAVVNVASNCYTHEPVLSVTRRVKGSSQVAVTQPHLVRRYNEGMGGVDLMDRLLAAFRPTIRGKKWWWPLFLNVVNVSVVAAWRLHCTISTQKMDHLAFLREITLCLLKTEMNEPRIQVGGGPHPALPDYLRFDGVGHHRMSCSQGRCRVCQANTRTKCGKCDARLHCDRGTVCFESYHLRH